MVDISVRTSSQRKGKEIEEVLELEEQKVLLNDKIKHTRKRLKPQWKVHLFKSFPLYYNYDRIQNLKRKLL